MSTAKPPEDTAGKPPVALIAGPTASGKSDLAVKLAQAIETDGRKAVVINSDSAQVYSDLKVLSARPTADEMDGIEHRLFGSWDGAQACSAADWASAAKREIAACHANGAVPILVGGTGLYMRTLLEGIAPIPEIDPNVRSAVRALSTSDARLALESEDREAADRLSPQDTSRTMRALEVVRSTGKALSYWQQHKVGGIAQDIRLHPIILLPDREWLYERCDRRFEIMLDQGAITEVEHLLARKLDPSLPVMRAIGVPEISAMFQGELSRAEAIAAGQTATRQYAKRQYTWFRNQPPEWWPRESNKRVSISSIFVSLLHNTG